MIPVVPLNTLPTSGNFQPDLLTDCQRHPVGDGQVGHVVGKKQSHSPENPPHLSRFNFPSHSRLSFSKQTHPPKLSHSHALTHAHTHCLSLSHARTHAHIHTLTHNGRRLWLHSTTTEIHYTWFFHFILIQRPFIIFFVWLL